MKPVRVKVKNVRSFADLDLELSPNLNVIYGRSDSGKSAFVKCLLFAIDNYSTKRTILNGAVGESFVSLSDGVSEVIRIRDKGINGYSIIVNGKETKNYNAISKDIPYEVSKVLNLSGTNIQQQKETYFLIDKTNGVISKKLNEVAGLSEIDTALKSITSEINTIASNIRETNNKIASDTSKIEDTKWTLQADTELSIIESLDSGTEALTNKISKIESLTTSYLRIKTLLDNLLPSSIIEDFKIIEDTQKEIDSTQEKIDALQVNIRKYVRTKEQYESYSVVDLSELEKINYEIAKLETVVHALSSYVNAYDSTKKHLNVVEQNLSVTEKSIREVALCPTCKRPMEHK
jgi:chromosome segregation ATPase